MSLTINKMKKPSVERGCIGKINIGRSYIKQSEKLAKKHNKQYGVYQCPHCDGYHLTTKLENKDLYESLLHITEKYNN
jgi:hypothetical protein